MRPPENPLRMLVHVPFHGPSGPLQINLHVVLLQSTLMKLYLSIKRMSTNIIKIITCQVLQPSDER